MNAPPIRKRRRFPKGSSDDIVRLNNLGMSLGSIGEILGMHATAITYRLKTLGIAPTDTRRSFMEDIYATMTAEQQQWLANKLDVGNPIKSFLQQLIVKEFERENP